MAFFRNRAVNLLNLHYGIHSIALSGGAAFFLIYLLNSGVPIPGVLVSLALILMARFVIRPVVVGFAARWGLRVMLVALLKGTAPTVAVEIGRRAIPSHLRPSFQETETYIKQKAPEAEVAAEAAVPA